MDNRERAWADLKRARKQAQSSRATWLEDLASARVEAGLEPEAHTLRLLKEREQMRSNFRRIKAVISNGHNNGLYKVQTLDPRTGQVTDHTTKEDLEAACLAENNARFRQTANTPMQHAAIVDALGPDGCSELATRILETGTVPDWIWNHDPFLGAYLSAHYLPYNSGETIATPIPTRDHIQGWSRARESTSSGISGIHFGHFKAGIQHDQIAVFEALMSSIPWDTGYSPKCWQKGVNVTLEKNQESG